MKLNDKRTPTCPHCGMAKLETEDVVDCWERINNDGTTSLVEQTMGSCPNCDHTFDYLQIFTHDPIEYECLEDVTAEEYV
jgi:hypothetical protein